MNGLANAKDYSYMNLKQDSCGKAKWRKLLASQVVVRQMEVELKGDEESMKKLIMRVGAVVIAVHADEAFLSITKGFYINDSCPKNDPNHAMVKFKFEKMFVFN
jgi:hypothetical protein